MQKKRTVILTILAISIVVGLIGLFKLNKDFLLIWNANTITVTVDSPLSNDKVKIEFGLSVNTISRKNDLALFDNRDKYTIIYEGAPKDAIFNEYGENDFLLTYNDQYYFSFRQFKFNRRHQHDYNFYFYKQDNNVYVEVNINGQDDIEFKRPMLDIAKAAKFVCNTPVDSAGGFYNMIELKKK